MQYSERVTCSLENRCRSLAPDEARFPRGSSLPLVIDLAGFSDRRSLTRWLERERTSIRERLQQHGAVLLRGSEFVRRAEDFEALARALEPDLATRHPFDDGVRNRRGKYCWEASGDVNGYRSSGVLPFHHEDAYIPQVPRRLLFCCLKAPPEGGETALVDARRVLADIPPAIVEKFEGRTFPTRMSLPIRVVLHNAEVGGVPELLEFARCNSGANVSVRGDSLVFNSELPAVIRHPDSGERVWYNQLGCRSRAGYFLDILVGTLNARGVARARGLLHVLRFTASAKGLWRLLLSAFNLDHRPAGNSVADDWRIVRAYWKNAVIIRWQVGDIIVLDNRLAAHGRMPFRGERDIVCALVH